MTPLLAELRSGHVVANLEALTASAADAARDLHKLQNEARQPDMHSHIPLGHRVPWHRKLLCSYIFDALPIMTSCALKRWAAGFF